MIWKQDSYFQRCRNHIGSSGINRRKTVWLNRQQMSVLFDRDVKTIGKHINNAMREELEGQVVVAKFATTTRHGAMEGKTQTKQTEYYNLDVIISVGYRVKSKRGVAFRKWANSILTEYIIKGYAINDQRLQQLGEVIRIMKRTQNELDAKQVLSVIENYNTALTLLDDYDHQCMKRPQGSKATYVLSYEECRGLIDQMRFGADSDLFGHEKDDSFKGSIGNIYQSFGGKDVYPTLEEKAANLLYFVTKIIASVTETSVLQLLYFSISLTRTVFSIIKTAANVLPTIPLWHLPL